MIHVEVFGLKTELAAEMVKDWVMDQLLKALNCSNPTNCFINIPPTLAPVVPPRIHIRITYTRRRQDVIRDELVPRLRQTEPPRWAGASEEGAWILEGITLVPAQVYIPHTSQRR